QRDATLGVVANQLGIANNAAIPGNPTTTTQATADNSTRIATTAFVKAQALAYAPLASPVFTGDPQAPTAVAGDADTSIATTAFVQNALASVPVGQCYLVFSTIDALILQPMNGNRISINGVLRTIADGGIGVLASGVAATTLYYIYAYWTGSGIACEYSTTAYAVQAGTGVLIKSGDVTRTLVGMWSSGATANAWSASRCEGVSWFNPRKKTQYGG